MACETTTGRSSRGNANTKANTSIISQRRYWHHKARPTAFQRWGTSCFADLPTGRVFMFDMPSDPDTILQAVPSDAKVRLEGGYISVKHHDRVLIDARSWASVSRPSDMLVAWDWVEEQIRREWRDEHLGLLDSPASTGRDLWMRTEAAEGCSVHPPEAQQAIRRAASQGRVETFDRDHTSTVHQYDMRLAYMACVRRMPMGELQPERSLDTLLKGKGFGRVSVKIPVDWDHVGLLGRRLDDASIDWPSKPGTEFESWSDACEIAIARRYGWKINLEEGWRYAYEGDPLRTWSERLLRIWELAHTHLIGDRLKTARAMLRAVMLQSIGAFHGRPALVTMIGRAQDVPWEASNLRAVNGGYAWREERPNAWPEAAHPEWSSHIWARARARMLHNPRGGGLMMCEPDTLVAVRTDAIYTTQPWKYHHDGGRPGEFVYKGVE